MPRGAVAGTGARDGQRSADRYDWLNADTGNVLASGGRPRGRSRRLPCLFFEQLVGEITALLHASPSSLSISLILRRLPGHRGGYGAPAADPRADAEIHAEWLVMAEPGMTGSSGFPDSAGGGPP